MCRTSFPFFLMCFCHSLPRAMQNVNLHSNNANRFNWHKRVWFIPETAVCVAGLLYQTTQARPVIPAPCQLAVSAAFPKTAACLTLCSLMPLGLIRSLRFLFNTVPTLRHIHFAHTLRDATLELFTTASLPINTVFNFVHNDIFYLFIYLFIHITPHIHSCKKKKKKEKLW